MIQPLYISIYTHHYKHLIIISNHPQHPSTINAIKVMPQTLRVRTAAAAVVRWEGLGFMEIRCVDLMALTWENHRD